MNNTNLLAFEQAQEWLAAECLIFDTETTGLGDDAEIAKSLLLIAKLTFCLTPL